jgi:hypothetical protein
MFLEDLRERQGNAKLVQSELTKAKQLVFSVIPHALRPKLAEVNHSLTYVAPWVAVLCVQIKDFSEFAGRETALETLRKFRNAISEKAAEVIGMAKIKSVGVSEYLMFNAAGELGDADAAMPVIWGICRVFVSLAVELQMPLQLGVSAETEVVMGLMSMDDLSFDLFARVLRTSRVLASRAPLNSVNVDKMSLPTFTAVVGCQSKVVTFKIGSVSYGAFECPLT